MALPVQKGDVEKCEGDQCREDQDSYIRDVASVWGRLDLVRDWLPHHQGHPPKITDYVLFPSAMYGQLKVLKLALPHGDLRRKCEDKEYSGWSLMHFAVEGIQRNLPVSPESEERDAPINNERVPPSSRSPGLRVAPPTATPPSSRGGATATPSSRAPDQGVMHTQLDIIMELAIAGVDPAALDRHKNSASYRACGLLETVFFEGSFLLDILTLLKAGYMADNAVVEKVETPGLSLMPRKSGWKEAMANLVEWAYLRDHVQLLIFCQSRKYVDLTSPKLLIKSNANTLRQCQNPLLIDALHRENYHMIQTILSIPSTPSNVLSKLYEYTHGLGHQEKESVFSFATHSHLDGKTHVFTRVLSLECDPKFITRITLSGVSLRRLPFVVLHENLTVLDVRDNNLDTYPSDGLDPYRLGWRCLGLQTLNFTKNLFNYIHPDIFQLPNLSKLAFGGNRIKDLPVEMWTAPLLSHLELNGNMIAELPCPAPIPRVDPMASFGVPSQQHRFGSDRKLQSWKAGYISQDVRSANDLHRSQIGFALHFLDLSENRFSDVPRGLSCLSPLLNTLRLSQNAITNLGYFSDYPSLLQSLDVSGNGITRGVQASPEDADTQCLQSQLVEGGSVLCTHYHHENLRALKFLYLCDNRIEDLEIECPRPDTDNSQTISEENDMPPSERDPPGLLYPKLQALKISDNSLVRFPVNVHRLTKLRELVVNGNERITEIPNGLHRLTSLFTFRFDGIRDPIVQELAQYKNTAEVLYHLKSRELQCSRNTSMRLFVIGHFSKGKSTLLKFLTGSSSQETFDTRTGRVGSDTSPMSANDRASSVGIECSRWVCTPTRKSVSSSASTPINFYTWDFAGQEEYYVTHQYFLTNKALYLLVWNVLDGDLGVDSLGIWLQNLQARAKGVAHTVVVVGTHLDQVPRQERDRKCGIWRDMLEKYRLGRVHSRKFPSIVHIQFVGCPPRNRGVINIEWLNNIIYDTAKAMESPRNIDDMLTPAGFKVKVLEEMIPTSYNRLRLFIESLHGNQHPPAMRREDFYQLVSHIIEETSEVEAAVIHLHATTGVVLHFNLPLIKDYYIINPQRWFDLCALVISPNNVSSLVRFGRPGDEKLGLLQSTKMSDEFQHRGCSESISRLIQSFLSQLGIIQQVNREYCLVPSAIDPEPALHNRETVGSFPRLQAYQAGQSLESMETLDTVEALVAMQPTGGILGIKKTGLIYRRMLLLPPIASGFWSKLITLCLQKQDFQQIVLGGIPREYCEWSLQPSGPAHRLRTMIGNLELSWLYWKTGIVLYVNETALLELHSLHGHEFRDPCNSATDKAASIFESRIQKSKRFLYESESGWKFVPSHYKDSIEVTVPEAVITVEGVTMNSVPPMSGKILVKALEIVDEVLKSQCEQFALTGIYSHNDMMQVIPCPIEYGDKDERYHDLPNARLGNLTLEESVSYSEHAPPLGLNATPTGPHATTPTGGRQQPVKLPHDCFCVFTVEKCIKSAFTSDVIICPKCGPLDLEFLAPDLLFSDVNEFKVDKNQLDQPVSKEATCIARGSFGIVFRRILHTQNDGDVDVAVKLFDQDNTFPMGELEPLRSYSDMRYELNKLCSLEHPHIVDFLGVITNPHCFVLEWAPLMSLETRRTEYCKAGTSMCPTAILHVLLQVTSALSYLHSPHEVGIVHRDLKSNNILVFRFPAVDHACFLPRQQAGDCRVLVKITDMGISTTPLAALAKAEGGLKIHVPEALSTEGCGLTEKVDIFTLGSCLYEMMTLRPLPPSDIGEPHYKQILLSGKRPQFYPKDAAYPPLLFQILEDCWQQEYYLRPSAEHLFNIIKERTHFSIAANQAPRADGHSILLDSCTLHEDQRVSVCHTYREGAGFGVCAAVGEGNGSVAIVNAQYRPGEDKNRVQFTHIGTIKNTEVISLQITPSMEVFIACSDGTICYFDDKHEVTSLNHANNCPGKHGDIVKVYYCHISKLLVLAFENGKVHIRKCTLGLKSHLAWRESCSSLAEDAACEILDMECLLLSSSEYECPIFEVWLGTNSARVEIWKMPSSPDQMWACDTLSRIRTVSHVEVARGGDGCEVRQLQRSQDDSMVAVAVYGRRGSTAEIVIIGVAAKQCLVTLDCKNSVSSILLTQRLLALGLYDGSVHLYNTPLLLASREDHPKVLHAHQNKVYGLHCLRDHVETSGLTSLFPTFVGRAEEEVERDFLISVGFGRGYPSLRKKKVFKKSSRSRGSFVNVWII